ncbi:uncharacterized protein LOC117169963 [Belonocnema kinseyi]|uniref:uncharacterized protein LOC117169963 n=1 Tax=Belonocnema kinseyi TaxID=2817044 RepID=UPI00143DE2A6|nr:uncharacterized protein LOC117169963 [Belonocnema kinseyi]
MFEITADTALPSQSEKFWLSETNKQMLQIFLRKYIFLNCNEIWPGVELVFSTIESYECTSTHAHLKKDPSMSTLQRFDLEEADTKMILHINDCCYEGARNILLLSSDTDILTLALNFWDTFKSNGLQELWMRVGVAATIRNLPVHKLANKMGPEKYKTIVAAHQLSGSDYTSKVGTKLSCLAAEPEGSLLHFGRRFVTFRIRRHLPVIMVLILRLAVPPTSLPPLSDRPVKFKPNRLQTKMKIWCQLRRPVRKSETNSRSEELLFIENIRHTRSRTRSRFMPLHKTLEDELNPNFLETNLNLGGGTTTKHKTAEYSFSISIQLFCREYPPNFTRFRRPQAVCTGKTEMTSINMSTLDQGRADFAVPSNASNASRWNFI